MPEMGPTTMTADEPMSQTELETCEFRILEGDVDAIRKFSRDAMKFHPNSSDELHRRRMILGRVDSPLVTPIENFALLSAFLGDVQSWELAMDRLGSSCDPGLGYLAWRSLLYFTQDKDRASKWFFAVERAAARDHFPAQRQVLTRKLEASNIFSGLGIRKQLMELELRRQHAEEHDPQDRRLAKYVNDIQ